MDIKTYFSDLPVARREAIAAELDTTVEYLMLQIGGGHRRASAELAKRIEVATNGAVTRHDLRPDIFDPVATQA